MSTKEAKLTFQVLSANEAGKKEIHGIDTILNYLGRKQDSFPLLNNGAILRIKGELGRTGVVILSNNGSSSNGCFAASLRSPNFIPQEVDIEEKQVVFGGRQTPEMIEFSLAIPLGKKEASQAASMVLIDLRRGFPPNLVSMANSGFAAIGSEPEAWIIDSQTGNLIPFSGGELQEGLNEETLPPIFNPYEFLKERAKYTLQREKLVQERMGENNSSSVYILDTSVLPTSEPTKPKVNTGHDLGTYVFAIQSLLKTNGFTGSDNLAESIFEQILLKHGIPSHEKLKELTGTMAYWVMAASHASVGLPHLRERYSEIFVPAEIAIAVADIFNSDLATVAEFLMFSTPMIYGVSSINVNGENIWPRDYRAILRYLMDTTNPAPFIGSYEEMVRRITEGIVQGWTHTADRSSYISDVNGRRVPVMHGRVRNRVCSSEPRNQTGRVEFTGCGASPSYLDEMARNCFLQILTVAALEAVENQQTPMEYWKKKYPHLTSWKNQKSYVQTASLYGFHQPEINNLILEAVTFIDEMTEKYPSLVEIGEIAKSRILNLLNPPVSSLKEYIENPHGPISEVIQNEIRQGVGPTELAGKIHAFQLKLSEKILGN